METFTKTVVVHHGLRQLNKVKYPTNQESTDYLLILQTNSKTLLQIIPAQIIDENDSFSHKPLLLWTFYQVLLRGRNGLRLSSLQAAGG